MHIIENIPPPGTVLIVVVRSPASESRPPDANYRGQDHLHPYLVLLLNTRFHRYSSGCYERKAGNHWGSPSDGHPAAGYGLPTGIDDPVMKNISIPCRRPSETPDPGTRRHCPTRWNRRTHLVPRGPGVKFWDSLPYCVCFVQTKQPLTQGMNTLMTNM